MHDFLFFIKNILDFFLRCRTSSDYLTVAEAEAKEAKFKKPKKKKKKKQMLKADDLLGTADYGEASWSRIISS